MIKFDSPLRRLPPGLERKQALVLDGLRHAAEMATLSDRRLREKLTTIATTTEHGTEESAERITSAYLDAWSIIDSIDRFRSLFSLMEHAPGQEGHGAAMIQQLQGVRNLRNVADHLATRIDYVIAKRTPALGYLRWVTLTRPDKGITCVLVPGTLPERLEFGFANAAGKDVRAPTGLILLAAGEYEVCICDAVATVANMVIGLESGLQAAVGAHGLQGHAIGADLLARAEVVFHHPKADAQNAE